jgi:hypothetical protein
LLAVRKLLRAKLLDVVLSIRGILRGFGLRAGFSRFSPMQDSFVSADGVAEWHVWLVSVKLKYNLTSTSDEAIAAARTSWLKSWRLGYPTIRR